jgi:hypothetical protein
MPGVLAVEVMIVFPFGRDAFTEFRERQSLAAENRPAVAGPPRTDRPAAAGQEKAPEDCASGAWFVRIDALA